MIVEDLNLSEQVSEWVFDTVMEQVSKHGETEIALEDEQLDGALDDFRVDIERVIKKHIRKLSNCEPQRVRGWIQPGF